MGVFAQGTDEAGTLEQTVKLTPGDYDLTLSGGIWEWNTYGGGDLCPYVEVFIDVDGKTAWQRRVGFDEEEFPEQWWATLRTVWTGEVKGTLAQWQDIFYQDYFEALARAHPNFHFHIALSQPRPEDLSAPDAAGRGRPRPQRCRAG